MAIAFETKDAAGATGTSILIELNPKGGTVPNLVMVQDSGKLYEFRVQCEMVFKYPEDNPKEKAKVEGEARDVQAKLAAKTLESLKSVEEIVTRHIDPLASPIFKDIVKLAFQDNYERLMKP